MGSIIVGITASLEEARANEGNVDDTTINGLIEGLMGPIAGIGDSLVVGTLIPVILGVALGMSDGGSPLGAIFYIIVWNLLGYFDMRFAYFKGYELGDKAVGILVGVQGKAIRKAIATVGGMVVVGVAATWVTVKTSFTLKNDSGKAYLVLQDKLDSVYP